MKSHLWKIRAHKFVRGDLSVCLRDLLVLADEDVVRSAHDQYMSNGAMTNQRRGRRGGECGGRARMQHLLRPRPGS